MSASEMVAASVEVDGRKVLADARQGIAVAVAGGDLEALAMIELSLARWTVYLVVKEMGIARDVAVVAQSARDGMADVVARKAAIGKGAFWGDKG